MPSDLQAQAEKWASLAATWHEAPAPASPSEADIGVFDRLSRRVSGGVVSAVILGSTPSLRRLLGRRSDVQTVTCVDFVPAMYEAASRFVPASDVSLERYVQCSWLEAHLHVTGADLVVGDKSLDNVPYRHWDRFFASAAGVLRVGGLLVLHVGLPDPTLAGATFEEILAKWDVRFSSGEVDLAEATAGLWEDLLSASASPADRVLSAAKFEVELTSYAASSSVAANFMLVFGVSLSDSWTRFSVKDVEIEAAAHNLNLVNVAYADDYAAAPLQPFLLFELSEMVV